METATESGNRNRPMCLSNTPVPTRAGKPSPIVCVDLRLLFGELGFVVCRPLEMETSPITPRLNFQGRFELFWKRAYCLGVRNPPRTGPFLS